MCAAGPAYDYRALATAGGTASWCTARTKAKVLHKGDLMVHKVLMRVRARRESRFGEPKARLHGTAAAPPSAQRRARTAEHRKP